MKIFITGVGQIFNFETNQMEDALHIQAENGKKLIISISNKGARELIELSMGTAQKRDIPVKPEVSRQPDTSYPEGAQIFGEMPASSETTDTIDSFMPSKLPHSQINPKNLFKQLQNTPIYRKDGVSARISDRSGVPSRTLSTSMVDEMGNPVMAPTPDIGDDEDDPGEQI
ncbi:MAG: hypothetical protein ACFFFC_00575 [Candidatus Thorarchaeota archaeon]